MRIDLPFFFIVYVATAHLTTMFYKKMEEIYRSRISLSLLNYAFDVTDQKKWGSYQPSHFAVKVKPEVSFEILIYILRHEEKS